MEPQEAREILGRAGLTQVALARWLGLNPRTVRSWLALEQHKQRAPIPQWVEIFLKIIRDYPEVIPAAFRIK